MRLTPADRQAIAEYLDIAAAYLRRLGTRDAFEVRTSAALSTRMLTYAEHADALRRKLQED